MKLILTTSISKSALKVGLDNEDILKFVKTHLIVDEFDLIPLCSPLPNIIAYKGYITKRSRMIIFLENKEGYCYPVYIGDKNDKIAQNITVQLVREEADSRLRKYYKDLSNNDFIVYKF